MAEDNKTEDQQDTTVATETEPTQAEGQDAPAATQDEQPAQPEEAPAEDAEQPTEEEPAQDLPGADLPGAEPSDAPAEEPHIDGPIVVSVDMMLFEAGMIANSLSSKKVAAALADKLFEAEQEAEQAGTPHLTFSFTPFEAGMALNGMARTANDLLDDLMNRLHNALIDKMKELGIDQLPSQGGGGTVGSVGDGSL